MLRWFGVLACLVLLAMAAPAFADQAVTLRPRVEASGPAITLGDVFDGAGAVGNRAIAPAPPVGQVATLSPSLLAAAASAAGLSWSPPAGLGEVRVVRPGGARATLPAQRSEGSATGDIAVRRGETVMLTFTRPGITVATHARALADGAVGESVRLLNVASNRTLDAIVTGPGAARAQTP